MIHKSEFCKTKKIIKKNTRYILIITAGISRLRANDYKSFNQNINIAKNLKEFFKESSIDKIIFLSTIDLYKKNLKKINEDSGLDIIDYYSLSKFSSEKILKFYSVEFNKKIIILRLPGMFGPGDKGRSTIGQMLKNAKKNKIIKLSNRGQTKRNFLYIEDFVDFFPDLFNIKKNLVINLVSGSNKSMYEVANIIKSNFKRIKISKSKERNKRDYDTVFDNSLVKKISNYKFRTLKKSINDYISKNG